MSYAGRRQQERGGGEGQRSFTDLFKRCRLASFPKGDFLRAGDVTSAVVSLRSGSAQESKASAMPLLPPLAAQLAARPYPNKHDFTLRPHEDDCTLHPPHSAPHPPIRTEPSAA